MDYEDLLKQLDKTLIELDLALGPNGECPDDLLHPFAFAVTAVNDLICAITADLKGREIPEQVGRQAGETLH